MKISKKKIVIFFIITILVIPLVIHVLFKINCNIYFFQAEWTAGDVLTAYASLLGAGATIFAVIITINYENGLRRKEEIAKNKPLLISKPLCDYADDKKIDKIYNVNNCSDCPTQLPWQIKNVSNAVANNLKFGKDYFYLYNENTKKYDIPIDDLLIPYNVQMLQVIINNNHIIEPFSYETFYTNFSCFRNEQNEFSFGNAFSFLYVKKYSYTDVQNIVTYENLFKMELNINIDVDNRLHLFIENYYNEEI